MGKPFKRELESIEKTYAWANSYDLSLLIEVKERASSLPMLAIGSGGSVTAAEILCGLQTAQNGNVAKVVTPLEMPSCIPSDRRLSVWLLSAGGNNTDILFAYKNVVVEEPKQLVVVCGDPNSSLIAKTTSNDYVDVFSFFPPSGKDGFLATNSLLAFAILLSRLYRSDSDTVFKYPSTVRKLWRSVFAEDITLRTLRSRCATLWKKKTIIVLYSAPFRPIAIDLESKFTEAALGNIQFADFRNFSHGRHHWLAKHGEDAGLLVFSTPRDAILANMTLSLLPASVPAVHIPTKSDGSEALIGLLVIAFHLVGWAGRAKDIDPGRPGVPDFGSKLYGLNLPRNYRKLPSNNETIIFRKSGVGLDALENQNTYDFWKSALITFRRRLANARFAGVIFDYDGTLVDARHRFEPPTRLISDELVRLLSVGIPIGVATGRGKSVRKDLRSVLPKKYWGLVLIGYYNGAEVGNLDDENVPVRSQVPDDELSAFNQILSKDFELSRIAKIEVRGSQLTITQKLAMTEHRLWDITNQHLKKIRDSKLSVLRSSHSIDVLVPGVSKLNLLQEFRRIYNFGRSPILTVGDRGNWPGNDYELLSGPYSLSVDEVSSDPATCWNLSPPGVRGVQAAHLYCKALITYREKGMFRFQYSRMGYKA
ncbi:MAG: HAD family phosphatase [Chromatiaceae bacterium]|nr:HAD family phosphatase [Chromatiaceae bacterium]